MIACIDGQALEFRKILHFEWVRHPLKIIEMYRINPKINPQRWDFVTSGKLSSPLVGRNWKLNCFSKVLLLIVLEIILLILCWETIYQKRSNLLSVACGAAVKVFICLLRPETKENLYSLLLSSGKIVERNEMKNYLSLYEKLEMLLWRIQWVRERRVPWWWRCFGYE